MFISFEGIDFCGKSTQVVKLQEYFLERKEPIKVLREPGGTAISEEIRKILLDKKNLGMCSETEVLLFSAARAQLVREVIRPSLNAGVHIILDRFFDSTSAYQGFGRGMSLKKILEITEFAVGTTIPELSFFIDIPLEEADRRKAMVAKENLDRIENSNMQFWEKVRSGYLELCKTESRFRKIDGTKTPDEIHYEIVNEIKKIKNKEV